MLWKYAMILVHIDSSDSNDIKETCKLVEVYKNYKHKVSQSKKLQTRIVNNFSKSSIFKIYDKALDTLI